uniref:histone-lysine N-methyltransferase SETMAR-like isoform X2 n=1 Tax=Myxine glutinosa TaxID=7769 RepID=UPI0035902B54
MDLTKIKHRAVIKFLCKEGASYKEIHKRMVAVYGTTAPSYSTVAKWAAEFKRGRVSLEDDPRSGRPADATDPQTVSQVEALIIEDRRVKVAEISAELGISQGSVFTIIHEHLGMFKVSARWVPRNIGTRHRQQRLLSCRELLKLFNSDPADFIARVVTGDETWLHHWDPETNLEPMQWKRKGSPPPKKFRAQSSGGKIMASFFWDAKGILLTDYMHHKTTITAEYYARLMQKLQQAIKDKRRGMLTKGVLLYGDVPVDEDRVAQTAICECGFEQLDHPPCSPDLVPSDYYLFRHLKSFLRGRRFASDKELIEVTETWLNRQPESFYFTGIESLKGKWSRCIEVNGHFIAK